MASLQSHASNPNENMNMQISRSVTVHSTVLCVNNDTSTLIAGTTDGKLLYWPSGSLDDDPQVLDVGEDEVSAVRKVKAGEWLVGCGSNLLNVVKDPNTLQLNTRHQIQFADDINGLDVNEKVTHAACADDTGCLTVIELKTFKVLKRLLGHENICSCVRFRPKSPWSIVTGGLDCMLILWDFKKGQALGSVNMADATKEEKADKDSYVLNPPLVHCLDISPDGLIAAAGLENGKIVLFTIGGKGFKLATTVERHAQGVSCMRFISDMTLVSAGNDCNIFVWKLSTARAPGKTLVWSSEVCSTSHRDKLSSITQSLSSSGIWVSDESKVIVQYTWEDQS